MGKVFDFNQIFALACTNSRGVVRCKDKRDDFYQTCGFFYVIKQQKVIKICQTLNNYSG